MKTGEQVKSTIKIPSYTKVFANTLIKHAKKDSKIVAITAAMPDGTGLDIFRKEFPDRTFDVGIAEQHAVTFAVGLAEQKTLNHMLLFIPHFFKGHMIKFMM